MTRWKIANEFAVARSKTEEAREGKSIMDLKALKLTRPTGILGATVVVAGSMAWLGATPVKAQSLTGAGATFPYPIYAKWFDTYATQKGVRINYQSVGSGAGIRQLKNKTVDFGATDAPLSNAELGVMPGPVVHIPTVAGAVAVTYNLRGVGSGLRLSGPVVADMFAGKITNWSDARIRGLNPGRTLPNQGITIAHRSDGSGTTNIFTNYLKAVSPSWARTVGAGKAVSWPAGLGGRGNDGVAGIVKQTPGSVGYVELAYAVQNRLAYATLRNRSGKFVAPSVAGVTAAAVGAAKAMQRDVRVSIVNAPGANAYPISGFTYILMYRNGNAAKTAQLKTFLAWAMGPGQRYATPLLYAPLPRSVISMNQKTLRGIR